MTSASHENHSAATVPAGDRALEFDFNVRAPLRAHIARCVNAGWKPDEILLALAEAADEIVQDRNLSGELRLAARQGTPEDPKPASSAEG